MDERFEKTWKNIDTNGQDFIDTTEAFNFVR